MTQLASGLETADYGMPYWVAIYNTNVQKLNSTLLKVQSLLDVNTDSLKDGAAIFWYATHGSGWWKTREIKLRAGDFP